MSLANAGEDIGPAEPDQQCEHGSTIAFPSDPHQNGQPLFKFITACDQPAVATVPNPSGLGQGVPLCEFHTARYREDFPDRFETITDTFDIEVSHRYLLNLEDVPPWLQRNGAEFSRIGIDQSGRAHYYRVRTTHALVLILDHRLDIDDSRKVDTSEYQLSDYIQFVGQQTGWATIDPQVGRRGGDAGDS